MALCILSLVFSLVKSVVTPVRKLYKGTNFVPKKYYWFRLERCYAAGMQIIKFQPRAIEKVRPAPNFDVFLAAMWLMFLRTPARQNPDLDGSFNLGEIGEDRTKNWSKATPYSLARPNV